MWALLSLAIGAFGIGMTEFVSMGLLPRIAGDLLPAVHAASPEDAVAQAGVLISLYALGVVIGAPTIAAFVSRFPRHRVLIALALALLVFNALTVVMPTFELVGLSRFLSGLPHGAYFGMAAVVAADLFGPEKRGRAISIVMSGLMIANVVGVPGGTLLGQQLGWRAAYVVVGAVFLLALLMIAFFVPAQPGDAGRTVRHELGIFRIPQVWLTVAIGSIGFGAFFAVYSYVATLVTEVAGAEEWVVSIALVAIGLGMTIGNLLGGLLADISVRRTLVYGLLALAGASALVGVVAHLTIALVIGLFVFATVSATATPTVQLRLLDVARDHQAIGAALNHSALNVGNSLGAALGGAVIAAGWGYVAPVWVGVVLSLVGMAIALVAFAAERRSDARMLASFSSEDTGTSPIPTV
ncbi:MFS transporter [Microbacterium barkeri]|uniref:MFS transporter n=1 Tax=Microbacterium barkeri TaxID=33917 RepID=A0A9W6LVB2_9MICO|nr:MFS transporter [Microbacterium barkeri]